LFRAWQVKNELKRKAAGIANDNDVGVNLLLRVRASFRYSFLIT